MLGRLSLGSLGVESKVSMPHAAFYVLGHTPLMERGGICRFNAARSILCVGTLSSPALVPRGLRSHFGKSSVFRAVFAAEMRSPDGKSHGRLSLFLVRRGLRHFGKSQRWNAACALLRIIFHFSLR